MVPKENILRKFKPNISIFQNKTSFITPTHRVIGLNSRAYYIIDGVFSKTMWRLFLYLRWHQMYKHYGVSESDFFHALESIEDENIVMTFKENGDFEKLPAKVQDLEIAVASKITSKVLAENNFKWDFIFVIIIIVFCLISFFTQFLAEKKDTNRLHL